MITTKQRAYLRSLANGIDTIMQIGKGGVNENMLIQMENALEARELIKCRTLDNCEYTSREAADGIASALDCEVIQVIGSRFVLFKVSQKHRKYDYINMEMIENKPEVKKTVVKPGYKIIKGAKPEGNLQNRIKPQGGKKY